MSKTLTYGSFVLVALILSGAYIISVQDQAKAYYCNQTGLVGLCDKLTTNNTRCYYTNPATNKSAYKTCTIGWVKYQNQNNQNQSNQSDNHIIKALSLLYPNLTANKTDCPTYTGHNYAITNCFTLCFYRNNTISCCNILNTSCKLTIK